MSDVLQLLQEFYREKLTALLSHQAGARFIGQYDINNTYQYIINREETQLSWVGKAIIELGGRVATDVSEPVRGGTGRGAAQVNPILEEDARESQAFVDRWRPRVEGMTHARHRNMLRVVLGETLEQKRFFEQARAGELDLLGRRTSDVGPRVGHVLSGRWIE